MQHLYFLRHCKTVLNEQGKISGIQDSELCEGAVINNFELVKAEPLTIISSDLGRCKQTIDLLLPKLEIMPIVCYSKMLRERNMGVFEGEKRDDLAKRYPCYFENKRFCFKMTPPEGESYQQIQKRVQEFIQTEYRDILSKSENSVLICAHNQLLKFLYCTLFKLPIDEEWSKLDFKGGEITEIHR